MSQPADLNSTDQQRAAIRARVRAMALMAGAGCGKTHVLTQRILSELEEEGAAVLPQIVALTFTKKAARELRDRLRAELPQLVGHESDAQADFLMRNGLDLTRVSTFHSYCASMLRRFAIEAGIDPEFREVDESVARTLLDRALRRQLYFWLAERTPEFMRMASIYGIKTLRATLASLVSNRAARRAWDTCELAADKLLQRWVAVIEQEVIPIARAALLSEGRRCLPILDGIACTSNAMEKRLARLHELLSRWETEAPSNDELEEAWKSTSLQGTHAKQWSTTDDQSRYSVALKSIAAAIDELRRAGRYDRAFSFELARRAIDLTTLLRATSETYDEMKQAAGFLDFNDLQERALELLRSGPEQVREAWLSELRLLLVDEFQDTDPTQWSIVERLVDNKRALPRLLIVGDAKQSIYRFRGARPKIFLEVRKNLPAEGRLTLNENFRSVPSLVHFVNALFFNVFGGEADNLIPTRAEHADSRGETVELLLMCRNATAKTDKAMPRREREADALASHLAQRLAAGWPVWDATSQSWRSARATDVAFLFRAMTDVDMYQQALAAKAIDSHIVGGQSYYSRQEVLDLVNLLAVIENPADEVALAAVLRAPCFGVSDEGLFWLGSSRFGGLAEGFANHERISDLNRWDRDRVARAARLLQHWHSVKDTSGIAALVDRVLDESGMEAASLLAHEGTQKFANLRKLASLARVYESEVGLFLHEFVDRIRDDLDDPPSEEQAAIVEEQGEAVRLMTIHQAKGREFPIVFLPDLDRGTRGHTEKFQFHDRLGLVPRTADNIDLAELLDGNSAAQSAGDPVSAGDVAFQFLAEREEREESRRLFYVATTRARDHLVLSSTLGDTEPAKSEASQLLFERFDRRTGDCLIELPAGWPAPRLLVREDPLDSPGSPTAETSEPASPAHSSTRVSARVAAAIEQALRIARTEPSPQELIRADKFNELTLATASGSDSRLAQLDALLRAALARFVAQSKRRESFSESLRQAGQAMPQRPVDDVIAEADRRFGLWVQTAIVPLLSVGFELRTNVAWHMTLDSRHASANPTRYVRGVADLLWKGDSEYIHIVNYQLADVSDAEPVPTRLRLVLSAEALAGPLPYTSQIVNLSADGTWSTEELVRCPEAAGRLLEEWLATVAADSL
jgi:ATP-dependent helicase/nuclease subunit A